MSSQMTALLINLSSVWVNIFVLKIIVFTFLSLLATVFTEVANGSWFHVKYNIFFLFNGNRNLLGSPD